MFHIENVIVYLTWAQLEYLKAGVEWGNPQGKDQEDVQRSDGQMEQSRT